MWRNDCFVTKWQLIFHFLCDILNGIPNWTTFKKMFFDAMFNSESDEMTAFRPSDSLTFAFYVTFSNNRPYWTTFVKEVFWCNVYFRKWRNDCIVTKWQLNFHFLCDNLKWHTKLNNFCKRCFLIWCLVYKVTKWLFCDQMSA